jgi:hypothetical protein
MLQILLIQKLFRGYVGRGKVKRIILRLIHADLKKLASGGPLKSILDIDCLSNYHSQLLLQSLIATVSTTDYRLYKSLPSVALLKEYRKRLTALINIKNNHDFITKCEYKKLYEDRKCMTNEDKRSLLLLKYTKMKEKLIVEKNEKEKQKAELQENEEKRRLKRKATQNIMYYLSDEQSHEKQERELMFGEETKARKYYSFLQSSGNAKYLLDCELMRQEDLVAKTLRNIDIEKKQEMEVLKLSALKVKKILSKGSSPKASPKGNPAHLKPVIPQSELVNSSVRLIGADKQKHYTFTCAHYTLTRSQQSSHPVTMECSNRSSTLRFNMSKFVHRELIHTLLMARHCRVMAYHTMSLALGAFKTHYNCLIKLRNELYSSKISTRQKRKECIAAAVKHESALVRNRQDLIVSSDLLHSILKVEVEVFTEVFSYKNNFYDTPELSDITEYKSRVKRGSANTSTKSKPSNQGSGSAGTDLFWSVHHSFYGPYPPLPPLKKASHTPDDRGYDEEVAKTTSAVDDASVGSEGNTTVVSEGSVSSASTNRTNKKKKERKGSKKMSREERSRLSKEAMEKTMEKLAIKERKHFDVPGFRVFLSKKSVVTQFDFVQWGDEVARWMTGVNGWFAAYEQKWKAANKAAIISSIQRLKYLSNGYPRGVIDTEDSDTLLLYRDSSSLHLQELLMYTLDVEVCYQPINATGSRDYKCVLTSSFLDNHYGKHPSSCLAKYLMDDFSRHFYSNDYSTEEAQVLETRSRLSQNRVLLELKLTDLEEVNRNKSVRLPSSNEPMPSLARILSLTSEGFKVEKEEVMLLLQRASTRKTFCTLDFDDAPAPILLLVQSRHLLTPASSIQVHRASSKEIDFQIPSWCYPVSRWSSSLDVSEYHRTNAMLANRKELLCDKYGKILLCKLKLRVLVRRTLCTAALRQVERDMMAHEDALAHVINGRITIDPNKKKGFLHNFVLLLLSKQRRARIAMMDEHVHVLTTRPWPKQRIDLGGIYRTSIDMHKYKEDNFIVDLPGIQNKRTVLDAKSLVKELQLTHEQRVKNHDWIVKKSHYNPLLRDAAVGGGLHTTLVLMRVYEQVDQSSNLVQVPKIEVYKEASGEDQVVINARLGYLLSRQLCDNNKGVLATKCIVNRMNRSLSDQAYAAIYGRNPAKATDKVVALPTVLDLRILFWKRFRLTRWGLESSEKKEKIIKIQSIWRRKVVLNRFHRAKHTKRHL